MPSNPSATDYDWYLPVGASIVNANNDSSSIQVVFGLVSGNICVQMTDDCAKSDTSCFYVHVNGLPTPANAGNVIARVAATVKAKRFM